MNLGFPEMLFLFFLALIIFGPKRLPEIGRQIGKGLAEFKRASNEFQAQIQEEVRRLELEDVKTDLTNAIAPPSLTNSVSQTSSSPAYISSDTTYEPAAELSNGNSSVAISTEKATSEEPTKRANA